MCQKNILTPNLVKIVHIAWGVQQVDRFSFPHNLLSKLKIFTVSMVTKQLLQILKNCLFIAQTIIRYTSCPKMMAIHQIPFILHFPHTATLNFRYPSIHWCATSTRITTTLKHGIVSTSRFFEKLWADRQSLGLYMMSLKSATTLKWNLIKTDWQLNRQLRLGAVLASPRQWHLKPCGTSLARSWHNSLPRFACLLYFRQSNFYSSCHQNISFWLNVQSLLRHIL